MLPTLAHSVSGVLYVDDAVTFRVENFTYDGQGPGIINIYAPTYLNMLCFSAHRVTDPYTIYFFFLVLCRRFHLLLSSWHFA